jgi:hypothetical protein
MRWALDDRQKGLQLDLRIRFVHRRNRESGITDRIFAPKRGAFARQDHDDATVEDFLSIVSQRTEALRNRRR